MREFATDSVGLKQNDHLRVHFLAQWLLIRMLFLGGVDVSKKPQSK
jgi:hypothetical protein